MLLFTACDNNPAESDDSDDSDSSGSDATATATATSTGTQTTGWVEKFSDDFTGDGDLGSGWEASLSGNEVQKQNDKAVGFGSGPSACFAQVADPHVYDLIKIESLITLNDESSGVARGQ